MTDTLIRASTALAVLVVAAIAAIISYQDAWEMVLAHGESGFTDRLLPCPVDGLILAASMVILDASRRDRHVPPLAAWSLGFGMAATVGANVAHGLGHGPIGALVSACRRWPWLALVRVADAAHKAQPARLRTRPSTATQHQPAPASARCARAAQTLEQTVRDWHERAQSARHLT